MKYTYRPKGTCSKLMEIEVEDGKLVSLRISGGCSGNTQGLAKLAAGMDVDDIIERLDGIRCGFKNTSCPDQLANALKQIRSGEV